MNTETSGSTRPARPVLVGVDDSESSISAVRWAAEEAVARGLPLELLHVTPYAQPIAPAGPHGAQSILARGRTVARRHADGVDVRTRLVTGAAATALVEASAGASLLVLGLIGGGRTEEILLGSTTLAVSGHAACPVVGVRSWPMPVSTRREIMLGLDADTEQAVLDTAFDMAEQRGCDVVVVHCTSDRELESGDSGPAWLEDELAAARRRHPAVNAHTEVHGGLAVNVTNTLLRQSARAEAVVVGTRNRGPAARILLGSTSRGLLRHSQVPVVVVGPEVSHDDSGDISERASRAARPTLRVPVAGGPSTRPGG